MARSRTQPGADGSRAPPLVAPGVESASEKRNGASPPRSLPAELHRSWYDGPSCYDTLEAAIRQVVNTRGRLGRLIVRLDIPVDAGITWSQTTRGANHHDLFGDRQALRR